MEQCLNCCQGHIFYSLSPYLPPVLLLWVGGGQGTNGRTRTINTVQRQLYSYSTFCFFSSSVIQCHVPLFCGTIRKYYSSSPTLSYPPLLGVSDTQWSHSGSVPVLMPRSSASRYFQARKVSPAGQRIQPSADAPEPHAVHADEPPPECSGPPECRFHATPRHAQARQCGPPEGPRGNAGNECNRQVSLPFTPVSSH